MCIRDRHSTGHSEAILTQTQAHADLFTAAVDSAAVYVNCSTRFTDGGEFGLGCEMGISTQKLHARGPMGLAELCSYKSVSYTHLDVYKRQPHYGVPGGKMPPGTFYLQDPYYFYK